MRLQSLLIGDARTQFKYGFYFIYLLFTVVYISLLYVFPAEWRRPAAILMIYSDPAAMGLYFMGAIILFEKSERVLNSIAVSPVKPTEYVISKLCSIGFISVIVAAAIGWFGDTLVRPVLFIAGVFLCSCLISSIGLIVACKISSLNQFIVATIPDQHSRHRMAFWI
jgi:fluoroquinolone transport system permease protein